MESETQLVVKSDPDIKLEIDVAVDPEFSSEPQHQCEERNVKSATASSETNCWNPSAAAMKREPDSQPASGQGIKDEPADASDTGTCDWSERNVKSATASSETDCWNPSAAAMKHEPDSQPASGQGIKAEPNDETGDVFHQFQSADNREENVDFKCDFSHEPGPSADLCSSPVDQADNNKTNRAEVSIVSAVADEDGINDLVPDPQAPVVEPKNDDKKKPITNKKKRKNDQQDLADFHDDTGMGVSLWHIYLQSKIRKNDAMENLMAMQTSLMVMQTKEVELKIKKLEKELQN